MGEFTCRVFSNPKASFRWSFTPDESLNPATVTTFDNQLRIVNEERVVNEVNFEVISKVRLTKNKRGFLKCEANNGQRLWNKTIRISKLIRFYTNIFIAPKNIIVFILFSFCFRSEYHY